jgi:hypothetical protein
MGGYSHGVAYNDFVKLRIVAKQLIDDRKLGIKANIIVYRLRYRHACFTDQ